MPTKNKLIKFCKISKYVEFVDKELYNVVEDLCLHRMFSPRRDINGITFLFPDTTLRNSIIKDAYSVNIERAIQTLQSLIILDYLPTCSDFLKKKDNLPNFLHRHLDIDDQKSNANTIKLSNGSTITPDPKFIPIKHPKYPANIAVFQLKGPIDLNGKVVELKRSRQNGKDGVVKGSREERSRVQLTELCEQNYLKCLLMKDFKKNSYLESVVGFMLWAFTHNKEDYNTALAVWDWDPLVMYYILFQPYLKNNNNPLVDFESWQKDTTVCAVVDDKLWNMYLHIGNNVTKNDSKIVDSTIVSINRNLSANVITDNNNLKQETLANTFGKGGLYGVYKTQNTTHVETDNLYPEKLKKIYSNNPCQKICHDEFRFLIGKSHNDILSYITLPNNQPNEVKRLIEELFYGIRLIYNSESPSCLEVPTYLNDTASYLTGVTCLYAVFGLYVPTSSDALTKYKFKHSLSVLEYDVFTNLANGEFFKNAESSTKYKHITNAVECSESFLKVLNELDKDSST